MRSVPFLRWLLVAVTMLTASISHAQMLQDESLADLGVGWSRTWVDVDGDGRDDFCYLTGTYEKDLVCRLNKQAGAETKTYPDLWQGRYAAQGGSVRWVDINGDGFVDVCRAVELSTSRLACRLGPTDRKSVV